jgi:uncharacterized protein YjiS (DUF1127 family)
MADITLNGAAAHHGGHGIFARARGWLAERAEYRRTVSELRRLDRRTLDDLGIAPHDIEAVARGRYHRG